MDLRPGMLVQWKPNLKNRKSPEYGKPAIVIEMLSPPVIDGTFESGSTYFREPLDIIIGFEIGRASCRDRVVSVRVDLGGRRIITQKKQHIYHSHVAI